MNNYAEIIRTKIEYHLLQAKRASQMLNCKMALRPDPYPLLAPQDLKDEIKSHEDQAKRLERKLAGLSGQN